MLKSQIHSSNTALFLLATHEPFISGGAFQISRHKFSGKPGKSMGIRHARRSIMKAIVTPMQKTTNVRGVITVQKTVGGILPNIKDDIIDLIGKSLVLELIAAELDSKTGLEKAFIRVQAHKKSTIKDEIEYECDIEIPEEFGEVGAVLVENEHSKEIYLKKIVLDGFISGPLNIECDSWIPPKFDNSLASLFFTNKSYLPSETPSGLKKYRDIELKIMRGDGLGERIYDYDVCTMILETLMSVKLKQGLSLVAKNFLTLGVAEQAVPVPRKID